MSDIEIGSSVHVSVLMDEVIDILNIRPGCVYVDGTLGGGGHAEAIARRIGSGGLVVAMDRDLAAIDRTERRLRDIFEDEGEEKTFPIRFAHANYRYVADALDLLSIEKVDGLLLDLGLSSDQLADANRGFSFDSEGMLDLRFDGEEGETGAELLARLREEEIADLIYQYGEERYSRKIARQIAKNRQSGRPIRTARELAELVRHCVPKVKRQDKNQRGVAIDPATRTFQALRIAVNDELGSLQAVLKTAPERMNPGAVMAVISFHSLEDRIVKQAFRDDQRWEILTKKPIISSEQEIGRNPRARSAKLRAAKIVR